MVALREFVYAIMTDSRRGPAAALARALASVAALFYGVLLAVRGWGYRYGWLRRVALPHPVISVGNLTVGGVGKTPLVEFLARRLQARGRRPVILTRGYMAKPGQASDEAQLLRRTLPGVPVLTGPDRWRSGREACARFPVDVFLLDDGFQHQRLQRDVDVVVVDAVRPFGNGHLLPRGILREDMSALSRADVIVLTKTDAPVETEGLRALLRRYAPGVPVFTTRHVPQTLEDLRDKTSCEVSFLQGQTVGCLAGIGDPQSFVRAVEGLGARVAMRWIFPDHHSYAFTELRQVEEEARAAGISLIVTTLKDAVKLKALDLTSAGQRWLALRVQIEMNAGEDDFLQCITDLLRR